MIKSSKKEKDLILILMRFFDKNLDIFLWDEFTFSVKNIFIIRSTE